MPVPVESLVELRHRQKPSARRAGEEQCLGGMPWLKPGDCNQARRGLMSSKTAKKSSST